MVTVLQAIKPADEKVATQRMTSLRRVYQKALETPIRSLDTIWSEYQLFENTTALNGAAAKFSPLFTSAVTQGVRV